MRNLMNSDGSGHSAKIISLSLASTSQQLSSQDCPVVNGGVEVVSGVPDAVNPSVECCNVVECNCGVIIENSKPMMQCERCDQVVAYLMHEFHARSVQKAQYICPKCVAVQPLPSPVTNTASSSTPWPPAVGRATPVPVRL